MLRKTMIVLLTAAALTGGLTADAFARGAEGGGGGHGDGFGGGGHMGGGFGRGHRTVIFPYLGDGSDYSDYDGAPTDAYPPPTAAVPAPDAGPACHRTSETFNVPAAGGGTRKITVIGCP
jgi:hypothetical protein